MKSLTASQIHDPHWEAAGRLLDAARLSRDSHVILQENLASTLAQFDQAFLQELTTGDELLRKATHGCYAHGRLRWGHKLVRDLEKPYTDAEVFQHVLALERDLKEQVARLQAQHGPFPCKIYVAGSLVKGRFGANSDLDVVLDPGQLQLQESRSESLVKIHVLSGNQNNRSMEVQAFQPVVETTGEAVASGRFSLLKLYRGVLEGKGIRTGWDPQNRMRAWKTEKHVVRPKESLSFMEFEDFPP